MYAGGTVLWRSLHRKICFSGFRSVITAVLTSYEQWSTGACIYAPLLPQPVESSLTEPLLTALSIKRAGIPWILFLRFTTHSFSVVLHHGQFGLCKTHCIALTIICQLAIKQE